MSKSKLLKFIGIMAAATALGLPATAQQGVQTGNAKVEKGVIYENAAVSFDDGVVELSEDAKQKLRQLVDNAREQGDISRAKIAVWSDQALPQRGNLSKAAEQLAQRRAENIENFLKDEMDINRVTTYEMAHRRNWVSRMYHRRESELQSAFGRKGEAPVTDQEFRAIKKEGGPSKAVIILEHKKSRGK